MIKKCNDCDVELVEGVNWYTSTKTRHSYLCKGCIKTRSSLYAIANPHVRRNSSLKKKYGISTTEYARLNKKQKGKCAICHKPETILHKKNLTVDHDHSTGKVRGLLCGRCNTALGMLNDDPSKLFTAIKYLEKYGRLNG